MCTRASASAKASAAPEPRKRGQPVSPGGRGRPVRPQHLISLKTVLTDAQRATLIQFALLAQSVECMFIPRSAPGMGEQRLDIPCDYLTEFEHRRPRLTIPFLKRNQPLCRAVLRVLHWAIPRVAGELAAAGVAGVAGKRCFASVMLVKPGAKAQTVHRDMSYTGMRGYYTAIVPATSHAGQGDTEFGMGEPFFTEPGPKAHRGDVIHRGGENRSPFERVCLSLVFCDGMDLNRVGYGKSASIRFTLA